MTPDELKALAELERHELEKAIGHLWAYVELSGRDGTGSPLRTAVRSTR
jgi:hypothetical protein